LLLAKEVVTAVIFSILFGKHTLSILWDMENITSSEKVNSLM
jgi:hypothetical protein